MTETKVAIREKQAVQAAAVPETEAIYVPHVDILENSEKIILLVDMPGVNQQSANVTVENNVLVIEGTAHIEKPDGYQLVGQEYGTGRYRRDFTLSSAVNPDAIKARMQKGVLEVTIPKKEEVKTRKITIAN